MTLEDLVSVTKLPTAVVRLAIGNLLAAKRIHKRLVVRGTPLGDTVGYGTPVRSRGRKQDP